MNFKTFMEMYDDWNGFTKVNDDNLNPIVKDKTVFVAENYPELWDREVVAFGFYDGELCVRVR